MLARVRQSIVQSFRADDPGAPFVDQVVVGTIGGAVLPTDPNPNTTPPSASRIIRLTPRRPALAISGNVKITFVRGSGSITTQSWFFDNTQGVWIPLGAPITLASPGALSTTGAFMLGSAKCFAQITANSDVTVMLYSAF